MMLHQNTQPKPLYPKLRAIAFHLHRWLGLLVGLLAIVIGITGSLLVFHSKIDHWQLQRRFGAIHPQVELSSMQTVVGAVKQAYASRPEFQIIGFNPGDSHNFYNIWLAAADGRELFVYVHPHTATVLGDVNAKETLYVITRDLHFRLFAGRVGMMITGIVGLFICILSLTGVILWPGWRKLKAGFAIKWNAHIKRRNFDLHKVAGISAVLFLAITGLTGFVWMFPDQTRPVIYAATLSAPIPPPQIQPPLSKTWTSLDIILSNASVALPEAKLTAVQYPQQPEEPMLIYPQLPGDGYIYSNKIYVNPYTGDAVAVQNGRRANLGDRILASFYPLHYGTFGGLPTKILYVFVGLAPLILFITGFVMWWHRKKKVMQ